MCILGYTVSRTSVACPICPLYLRSHPGSMLVIVHDRSEVEPPGQPSGARKHVQRPQHRRAKGQRGSQVPGGRATGKGATRLALGGCPQPSASPACPQHHVDQIVLGLHERCHVVETHRLHVEDGITEHQPLRHRRRESSDRASVTKSRGSGQLDTSRNWEKGPRMLHSTALFAILYYCISL